MSRRNVLVAPGCEDAETVNDTADRRKGRSCSSVPATYITLPRPSWKIEMPTVLELALCADVPSSKT